MKVLVIGSGGREHALVHALHSSPSCTELVCAPGNPGIEQLARCVDSDVSVESLVRIAADEQPDLVVVGPEAPLVDGVADQLRARGVAVFGPGAAGAELEGSKWFAKQVLEAAGVATARARAFTDVEPAVSWIREHGAPVVVKADGLAAGKGVTVATTEAEAEAAVRDALAGSRFGDAGTRVVIEECLTGPELSVLALVSGDDVRVLAPARDHKRAHDGDTGPNTGGMGAVSPPPDADAHVLERVEREILRPVVAELRRRGIEYRGVLYAGLMLTEQGPQVIEFNVRFGDPEAQVVLPRLRGDVASLLHAVAVGRLRDAPALEWDERACVGIVVAAEGYPAATRTGDAVACSATGADGLDGLVYWAGVSRDEGGVLRTAGGRVATAVGMGTSLGAALDIAQELAATVAFEGAWHRTDIGRSSLARTGSLA